ncbi:MAG: ComEC/Rec2 family competence protein, partial [Flavobacteriaceae bacterium]
LAISGLHVGIILWLLSLMFNPIESFKKGKEIKLFLMILFLWLFALLAGMSASVTRSVTMFSAVAIGYFFNKKNAIEHSLIFSMFILLLVKPLFLFDVGFQLSYLAVFGIIWIQPLLYKSWTPKFNILDKGWQLFTVSLAAQIGVLPLSLFYFHQFPGLFFVSNLLIVPFLGLILGTGIIILTLAYFAILPDFMVTVYASVISTLNQLVALIAKQETFLLSDISFSAIKMVLSYVTILVGFQFLLNRNVKRCLLFLSMVLIFQSFSFYEKYETERTNQFVVFHKSRNSIVGNRVGAHLKIYHNMDTLIHSQNLLKNYTIGENIQHVNYDELPSLLKVNSQIILCVDTNGNYDIQDLKKPIVLLQQSPKINLERLIKRLNPSIIIADGSNYKSDVNLWKTSCLKLGISFWSTREKGAYVYEYKNQLF